MTRSLKIAAAGALLVLAATLVWAQPRGQGGGGRMGGPGMNAEQTLGYLALDPGIGLTDPQLINLRNALREPYKKQMEARTAMRSGDADFQAMREQMMATRAELTAAVAGVLTPEQNQKFTTAMEQMQQARGQGRGGRPGND
ncbi:MAG: hypothetical protein ABIL09_03480 [Gemmatimonadota bacterium]